MEFTFESLRSIFRVAIRSPANSDKLRSTDPIFSDDFPSLISYTFPLDWVQIFTKKNWLLCVLGCPVQPSPSKRERERVTCLTVTEISEGFRTPSRPIETSVSKINSEFHSTQWSLTVALPTSLFLAFRWDSLWRSSPRLSNKKTYFWVWPLAEPPDLSLYLAKYRPETYGICERSWMMRSTWNLAFLEFHGSCISLLCHWIQWNGMETFFNEKKRSPRLTCCCCFFFPKSQNEVEWVDEHRGLSRVSIGSLPESLAQAPRLALLPQNVNLSILSNCPSLGNLTPWSKGARRAFIDCLRLEPPHVPSARPSSGNLILCSKRLKTSLWKEKSKSDRNSPNCRYLCMVRTWDIFKWNPNECGYSFNKRQEDFGGNLKAYNDYLEELEEIGTGWLTFDCSRAV